MLISTAYAQTAASGGGDLIGALMPLVLIFAVFWFLVLRPQQKRAKEHREMVENVRRGDQIITAGGIYGKVDKVMDDEAVRVEIAEGVKVKVVKATIQSVMSKTEPAKDSAAKSDDEGKSSEGEKKSLFSFGSKK